MNRTLNILYQAMPLPILSLLAEGRRPTHGGAQIEPGGCSYSNPLPGKPPPDTGSDVDV